MPETLREEYEQRYKTLVRLADAIAELINDYIKSPVRVDRITARAKSVDRFIGKANKKTDSGELKYDDPLNQIQDQIGARIIVFYKSDVDRIAAEINRYLLSIEHRAVIPDTESSFGYFGRHLILRVPTDAFSKDMNPKELPEFFELQIKTLFQHAWSEADHDLGYKPGATSLTSDQVRRIAYTSAQAWGADEMFEQLFQERQNAEHS